MSPQLHRLPYELVAEVLTRLPKSDLKSARLTCARLGRIGAQWLFQRVYFAPRQSAIETFLNVSSNPEFAQNVTELVYDGRLFLKEFTDYESYKETYFKDCQLNEDLDFNIVEKATMGELARLGSRDTGDEDDHEDHHDDYQDDYHDSLVDTLVGYTHLFNEQQQIIRDKRDYEALCAGLQNLPNITIVLVLDNFFQCEDWIPVKIDDHLWYHEQSQRETAVPIPPSSWHPRRFNEELGMYEQVGKWDFRGIQNLIRAVSEHGHQVFALSIGSERSKAPGSIFAMNQDVWAHGCRMAQRLHFLKMDFYCFVQGNHAGVEDDGPEYRLEPFLSEAKQLRLLAISGHMDPNLLTNNSWPHLETLILADISLWADQLRAITQTYKGTLREIKFRFVTLFGNEEFADVAKEVGIDLRLRRVCISKVSDDLIIEETREPYTTAEIDMAVARSFMQSIPRTTLSGDYDNGFTIVACPEENTS